jgi:hypothetical protein
MYGKRMFRQCAKGKLATASALPSPRASWQSPPPVTGFVQTVWTTLFYVKVMG